MKNKVITIGMLAAVMFLSGCASNKKTEEEQVVPEVPEGFVKEINSSAVINSINALSADDAIVVSFATGSGTLTIEQKKKLDAKLAALPQEPMLIAVQGAAGPAKYMDLGKARQLSVIGYLRSKGIQTIMVDYDENKKGGRANLWVLKDELLQSARISAASLIIYP